MIDINFGTYVIILPLIFLAGLVDAIAGGGGLISVPAYLAAGLPVHFALGNNKFSSCFGTMLSTSKYLKHGMIDIKVAVLSAVFALVGSAMGTKTVLLLSPGFLNYLLVILIPIMAIFTLTRKNFGIQNKSSEITNRKKFILSGIAGVVIGFYDGFFGPGTGAFLIIFYTTFLHYDFIQANANTKVVNLASNLAALSTFLIHGKVIFSIAIPAMIFGMCGNWVGSKLVIKKGSKFIKPVFIIVLLGLFVKIVVNIIVK